MGFYFSAPTLIHKPPKAVLSESLSLQTHHNYFYRVQHQFSEVNIAIAFPNCLLTYLIWRLIGLSLTTTILGLGALAILLPPAAADSLRITPTIPEGRIITKKGIIFLSIYNLAAIGVLF